MNLKSKLPHLGTNIFSVMSALAKEHKAINLSQGFPDFEISSTLVDLVSQAMKNGNNQYAPMPGLPELRTILAEKIYSLYKKTVDPESEITITPGATYAIYTAFATIIEPGDEVILLEPAYDSYMANIISLGASPITVPLDLPEFTPNWLKIKDAITTKTKAIIINTPHNPCGSIFTNLDWKNLHEIIKNRNIFVISDEVYEHIVFDNHQHESILKHPELWDRTIATYSFGKVFHATGWKMGYTIAPKNIMAEYRKIHQFLCFSCNTPMQYGLAEFLKNKSEYLSLNNFYEQKRNLFLEKIKDTPFTIHAVSKGTYFQIASYENISTLPDKEFAIWLLKNYSVATIPLSAFYHNQTDHKLIRFCFAKKDETILNAISKLADVAIL